MTGDKYPEYGSDKSKDKQSLDADDFSDADFNSNYGSDIDEESLPAYESPAAERKTTVVVAWTSSVPRSPASTDDSDDCVVRLSSLYFCDLY